MLAVDLDEQLAYLREESRTDSLIIHEGPGRATGANHTLQRQRFIN